MASLASAPWVGTTFKEFPAVIVSPIMSCSRAIIEWYASIPICLELCTETEPVPYFSAFSIAISIALGKTCKPKPSSPSTFAVVGDSLVILKFGFGFIPKSPF